MGRTPCCNAQGLKKGAWTPDEDQKLIAYINQHGQEGWRTLPHKAGLSRCGKSCRLRWCNYLSPAIKREEFTPDEDEIIINLNATLGNRWSIIARQLPGRTDNDIKNYWNTHLKKRIIKNRIDQLKLKEYTPLTSASNGAYTREPDSSSSCRSISKSAQLLNKVATNVAPFRRLPTVRSIVGVASNKSNPTTVAGVDCIDDTDPDVLDISQKSRVSVSASAKLLNKTATRLGSPRLGISTLISILSSKPAEVGRRDCPNSIGSGSLNNPEFLDSLDLFDNSEVFSTNDRYNVESPMSTLHLEWNISTKTTAMPKCDSNELFFGTCEIENEAVFTWLQENPFDSPCGFSSPDVCF